MALHIAPRGWDHDGWAGSFFPDDLPPEWRLIYLCNHFDAVVVPEQAWQEATPERLRQWAEECAPATRLYLESGAEPPHARSDAIADALGDHFHGFLSPGGEFLMVRWSEGAADLRKMRSVIEQLAATGREALFIVEGMPPSMEALRAARTIARLLGLS